MGLYFLRITGKVDTSTLRKFHDNNTKLT